MLVAFSVYSSFLSHNKNLRHYLRFLTFYYIKHCAVVLCFNRVCFGHRLYLNPIDWWLMCSLRVQKIMGSIPVQINYYITLVYCCFSIKHTVSWSESMHNDWLAQNQDNVYEWGYMFTSGLLFSGS